MRPRGSAGPRRGEAGRLLIIDVACRHSAKTRDLFDKIKTLTIKEDTSFQSCFILPPNYSNAVSQFVEFACNELRRIV